jgi:excinuclease ABC subunit C
MMMRGGKIIGSEGFMMRGSEQEDQGEWVQSFLQQFYFGGVQLPSAIIVRQRPEEADILEEIFSEHQGRKVHIEVPVRGERRRLLLMAEKNAAERFHRELNSRQREWERTGGAVNALGKILGIPAPQRIECYDISNIQGTDSVASMVVFEQGKPARSQYRRFRIKTVEGANDFESRKEVVGRRFRHGLEDQAESDGKELDGFARFPQLVMIDGGPVQLAFAREAMKELGVDIPAIGLAKRNEEIILPDRPDSLILEKNTAELHLLQRIRDEAHRFAITYHRSLRTTRALRSQLEEVPGIGPKRRKALLKAFPLPAQLQEATVEELAAVESMNHNSAQAVWDALHPREKEQAE